MPFLCEPIVETRFKSLKDVDGWISGNEDRLERVSIRDWIERGARFFDDEYFGDEGRFLRFNQNGIRVLLQKLGLHFDTLATGRATGARQRTLKRPDGSAGHD